MYAPPPASRFSADSSGMRRRGASRRLNVLKPANGRATPSVGLGSPPPQRAQPEVSANAFAMRAATRMKPGPPSPHAGRARGAAAIARPNLDGRFGRRRSPPWLRRAFPIDPPSRQSSPLPLTVGTQHGSRAALRGRDSQVDQRIEDRPIHHKVRIDPMDTEVVTGKCATTAIFINTKDAKIARRSQGSCPLCIRGVLCVSIPVDNLGENVRLPIAAWRSEASFF